MKICSKCKVEKTLTGFSKHAGRSDGFSTQCKSCDKAYKLANKEHAKELRRVRESNPDVLKKLAKQKREYNKKNADKVNANRKLWAKRNPKKMKQYREKRFDYFVNYRLKNKDKIKDYLEKNKEQLRAKQAVRENILRKTNPNFKLKQLLRGRLYKALIHDQATKSAPTLKLLGSSVAYVKKHLEAQFVDGMSWDNHGEWHIDHIRPCASFDLSDPEQQKECFNYKNLQPLWAEDNLRKGDR